MEDKLYFVGGVTSARHYNKFTFVYDPDVDKWSNAGFNDFAMHRYCMVVVGHIMYVVGGTDETEVW